MKILCKIFGHKYADPNLVSNCKRCGHSPHLMKLFYNAIYKAAHRKIQDGAITKAQIKDNAVKRAVK